MLFHGQLLAGLLCKKKIVRPNSSGLTSKKKFLKGSVAHHGIILRLHIYIEISI